MDKLYYPLINKYMVALTKTKSLKNTTFFTKKVPPKKMA